jgi:hypothetical protein
MSPSESKYDILADTYQMQSKEDNDYDDAVASPANSSVSNGYDAPNGNDPLNESEVTFI